MRNSVLRMGIAVLCVAAAWNGVAFSDDEIEQRSGEGKPVRIKGRITDENPRRVVIETASGEKEIPNQEIVSIRYDGEPADVITARGHLNAGRLEEAEASYKSIYERVKNGRRDFLKSAMLFNLFKTQAQWARQDPAKVEDAMATYNEFVQTYKRSRYDYPIREMFGELCLNKGDFDAAQQAYAGLRDCDWPGYQEKAAVYEGLALMQKGKLNEASNLFDQVARVPAGASAEAKQQKSAAQVFKAQVLLRQGTDERRLKEAERLLRTALKEASSDDRLVFAMGYNALGDLLRAAKKPAKEALVEGYLRVVVLYNEDGRELARAMYNASTIFNELGQRDRADRLAEELRTRFPNSPWTKKLPSAAG